MQADFAYYVQSYDASIRKRRNSFSKKENTDHLQG